jgi:glycosyltransferase involved in cell wall biosynthesis
MNSCEILPASGFAPEVLPASSTAAPVPRKINRVLHVLKHCGYGNGNVNVAVDLACIQAEAGREVAVASGGGVFERMLAHYGVRHLQIEIEQSKPLQALSSSWSFLRFVDRFHPDVIHAHMMSAAIIGKLASAVKQVPLVTTVHNSFDRHSGIMRLGRRVVAVSEAERASLIAKGYSPHSLDVVLNAPVGSPREAFFLNPTEPVLRSPAVLAVCGLHRRKGVDDLLRAWAEIAGDLPEWRLYIAGEGPDREQLEELVHSSGIAGSVTFFGFIPSPQTLFRQADIFVLPSLADPCSLVIGEARGAGCAIVATAVGGTPEMLEFGAKGLLVPPRDPSALAAALSSLMRDPVACAVLKAESSRGAEQFHVRNLLARYEQVYLKALHPEPQRSEELSCS